jgi:hypothetical protein
MGLTFKKPLDGKKNACSDYKECGPAMSCAPDLITSSISEAQHGGTYLVASGGHVKHQGPGVYCTLPLLSAGGAARARERDWGLPPQQGRPERAVGPQGRRWWCRTQHTWLLAARRRCEWRGCHHMPHTISSGKNNTGCTLSSTQTTPPISMMRLLNSCGQALACGEAWVLCGTSASPSASASVTKWLHQRQRCHWQQHPGRLVGCAAASLDLNEAHTAPVQGCCVGKEVPGGACGCAAQLRHVRRQSWPGRRQLWRRAAAPVPGEGSGGVWSAFAAEEDIAEQLVLGGVLSLHLQAAGTRST